MPPVLVLLALACSGSVDGPGSADDSDGPADAACSGGTGGGTGGSAHSAGSLPYYRYVPEALPPCSPLLLFGHPGSRPGEIHQGVWEDPGHTDLVALADSVGFVLVVPGANPDNTQHDWSFDLVPEIDALTRDVRREYDIDERRIWFAGVSAGGHMAGYLGLYDPTVFTGIGVVAAGLGAGGFGYPETEPEPKLPFYVAHDPGDQVIDYEYSVALADALASHGHTYAFEDWTLGNGDGHGWNRELGAAIVGWLDGQADRLREGARRTAR
jgi:poly(3-hydroxybutyrate) depolymerase